MGHNILVFYAPSIHRRSKEWGNQERLEDHVTLKATMFLIGFQYNNPACDRQEDTLAARERHRMSGGVRCGERERRGVREGRIQSDTQWHGHRETGRVETTKGLFPTWCRRTNLYCLDHWARIRLKPQLCWAGTVSLALFARLHVCKQTQRRACSRPSVLIICKYVLKVSVCAHANISGRRHSVQNWLLPAYTAPRGETMQWRPQFEPLQCAWSNAATCDNTLQTLHQRVSSFSFQECSVFLSTNRRGWWSCFYPFLCHFFRDVANYTDIIKKQFIKRTLLWCRQDWIHFQKGKGISAEKRLQILFAAATFVTFPSVVAV